MDLIAVDDFGENRLQPKHLWVVSQLVFRERLLLVEVRCEHDEGREGELDEPFVVVAE